MDQQLTKLSPKRGSPSLLSPEEIVSLLQRLGFSSESIHVLERAARSLESDTAAKEKLANFCAEWPAALVSDHNFSNSLWLALAIVQAFPATIERQAARGFPFDVTADTLCDLQRKMSEYRDCHGQWGLDRLDWMRHHVTDGLFSVGRLQYQVRQYGGLFQIYRSGDDSVHALADEGLSCSESGWPKDGADDFRTILQNDDRGVLGHEACPQTGAIRKETVFLSAPVTPLLGDQDPVLIVHIPGGGNFTPETCRNSLRSARRFFDHHFHNLGLRAICCQTWLLDRALNHVLPPDSHIISFGRLFRPLAVNNANGVQHLQRIFGRDVDWRTFEPRTSLQREDRDYLSAGGTFRLTSGYILWDDPLLTDREEPPDVSGLSLTVLGRPGEVPNT